MDNDRALEIISALASGIDPLTGEVFPSQSMFQNPDIVCALFIAANALQVTSNDRALTASQNPNLPKNVGAPWSEAEDRELVTAFDAGSPQKELAAAHERTPGAIRSRLVKLGKLERTPSEPNS